MADRGILGKYCFIGIFYRLCSSSFVVELFVERLVRGRVTVYGP